MNWISRGRKTGADGRRDSGMTILELLVVMTIIAMMAGMTVGMLRRSDPSLTVEVSGRLMRSILRQARNSAQSTGGGVMVRLDTERGIIEASPLELGGNWHFEDDYGSRRERVASALELVEDGKMGRAVKVDGSAIDLGSSIYYGGDQGIRLVLWLKPERLSEGTIFRRENGYNLILTQEGGLRVEVGMGAQKEIVNLRTRGGLLEPGKWTRVALTYDRVELSIEVDGVLQATLPETRPLFDDNKVVHVSIGGGYSGLIDELRLDVARSGLVEEIPAGVDIQPGSDLLIRFDGRGRLDRRFHKKPVELILLGDAPDDGSEGPGEPVKQEIRVEFSGAIR